MPYKIRKVKGGWGIYKKSGGKRLGKSRTKANAKASIRAREAADHGWKR